MAVRSFVWLVYALVLAGIIVQVRAACSPGTFTPDSGRTCQSCPPGTWQDQSNSPTCKDAQPGWFASGYGNTEQSQCVPGFYSTGLAAECTICPAGSHCNGYTNTQPQLCEPGRYSSQPGAGQDCDLCPPGQFSNIEGATACCSCCSGWYTDQSGQTHCFNCPNRGAFQQGFSPVGASSAGQCIAAPGALSSCSESGKSCPPTGGSSPSGGAHKRAPVLRAAPKKMCARPFESCPIPGLILGSGAARAYECVDVENDLESCGGCVDGDSPHGEANLVGGRDCSAIPNIDSVRCLNGQCVIERCHLGYVLAQDGQKCRPLFGLTAN
ncbi:hypothetical protein PHLGIDRAFT_283461 [Phlebiopsis gigantea 11061_1 CR5-6]|uniref:Protein CPL1-like domain-containing protein n=1 Tax=Phlebiopsis gigantea (strain 11061_1 CR5-6) TaxID=745531 RepID=A0A0C3S418_PHLG1|nr:hypothetical protein PHLGIDRAFT_283461 [Phlebiopsis gigantea 11061_1 CR5-6]